MDTAPALPRLPKECARTHALTAPLVPRARFAEIEARIIAMRDEGMSYGRIARTLGAEAYRPRPAAPFGIRKPSRTSATARSSYTRTLIT